MLLIKLENVLHFAVLAHSLDIRARARRTIKKPPFRSFITERAHYSSHAPLPHSNHPPVTIVHALRTAVIPSGIHFPAAPTRNHISVLLNAFTDSPFLQTVFFFRYVFFLFLFSTITIGYIHFICMWHSPRFDLTYRHQINLCLNPIVVRAYTHSHTQVMKYDRNYMRRKKKRKLCILCLIY